jgi:hypothetical protein
LGKGGKETQQSEGPKRWKESSQQKILGGGKMNNHELMREAENAFSHFCKLLEIDPWEEVDMVWGAGKRVWGTANYNRKHMRDAEYNFIELNLRSFRCNPHELRATVAHEVAHMALFFEYGRSMGHGREFKALMRELGFSGKAGKAMLFKKPRVGAGAKGYGVDRLELESDNCEFAWA